MRRIAAPYPLRTVLAGWPRTRLKQAPGARGRCRVTVLLPVGHDVVAGKCVGGGGAGCVRCRCRSPAGCATGGCRVSAELGAGPCVSVCGVRERHTASEPHRRLRLRTVSLRLPHGQPPSRASSERRRCSAGPSPSPLAHHGARSAYIGHPAGARRHRAGLLVSRRHRSDEP